MSEKNTDKSRATGHAPKDFQPFHSAVNRIPLLRETAQARAKEAQTHATDVRNAVGAFAKTVFHDGVAEGHDRLKLDRWSGSIDVEMTVHTPLVFGRHDGAQSDTEENSEAPTSKVSGSHRSKECEDGTPEEPFISPTMVKGMVSRAYETLTASRFRVFGSQSPDAGTDHRTPLNYKAGRNRLPYKKSPWDLAKDQWALPLSKAKEASAADRLFGYVVQKTGGDEAQSGSPGDVALRGRIEFGPIDASGPNVFDPSLKTVCKLKGSHPLPPLLEPKPSSARRFITDEEGKTPLAAGAGAPPSGSASTQGSAAASGSTSAKANAPNWSRQAIARRECFSSGQFLGIAAYPVHRCRLKQNELPSAGGQVLANGKETEENVKVSLLVTSFIQAGSMLRCRIRFTDLAQEELAALLWVLTPENLVPRSVRDKHTHAESEGNKAQPSATKPPIGYLRMGLGKPFGLGAIEVRATSMTAYKGEDLAERYEALDGCLGHMPTGPESPSPSIADFSSALDDYKLDEQPWVQAMQRAAYGYDDGVEVRYMSLNENKENNQTDKKGNPKRARLEDGSYEERGVSPTDLFSPGPDFETYRPAPISISVTKKKDQKNRNGQGGNKSDTKGSRRGRNNNSTCNGSSARRSRRKRGQNR